MKPNNRSRSGGFTLLEVMIAMAIMSISLVGLLAANNRALTLSAEAETLTAATMLAREEMEALGLRKHLPEPGTIEKRDRDDFPNFDCNIKIGETPFNAIREATITVDESYGGNNKNIVTLKAYFPL